MEDDRAEVSKSHATSGRYQIERHLDHQRETVHVISPESGRRGGGLLERLLAGIDESLCKQVFAVGLHEMQQLASLNDTQAAEQLYGLATGHDRVSLHDVVRGVTSVRRALYCSEPDANIQQLVRRRHELEAQLGTGGKHVDRWQRLQEKLRQVQHEVGELEDRKKRLRKRQSVADICAQHQTQWDAVANTSSRRVSGRYGISFDVARKLRRLARQDGELRAKEKEVRDELKKVDAEGRWNPRKSVPLGVVAAHEPRDLRKLRDRMRHLHDRRKVVGDQVEEVDFEIQAEWEQAGLGGGKSSELPQQILGLRSDAFTLLQPAAREVERAKQQLEQLERQCRELTQRRDGVRQQTRSRLAGRGDGDVVAAIQRTGERLNALRRCEALGQEVDQLESYLAESRREANDWVERQLLPFPLLSLLALVFGIGGLMAFSAIFQTLPSIWASSRFGLGISGLFLMLGSVTLKVLLQWSNESRLELARKQMDRLRDQRGQAVDEMARLEKGLPSSNQSIEERMREAERELRDLERLLADDSQQQQIERSVAQSEHRRKEYERAVGDAERRWQSALQTLGISSSVGPTHVAEFVERMELFQPLREKKLRLQAELEQVENELRVVDRQVEDQLMLAKQTPSNMPQSRLAQFEELLQRRDVERKKHGSRQQKARVAYQRLKQVSRQRSQLKRQQSALAAPFGIVTAKQLKVALNEFQAENKNRARREQLLAQIKTAASAVKMSLGHVQAALKEGKDSEAWKRTSQQYGKKLSQCERHLARLIEQRGSLQERLRAMQHDRTHDTFRFELTNIQNKLREATRRWQVVSAVSQLLEKVRGRFERERQPETLDEASVYLAQMTLGKYERIWTPFGGSDLKIDTNEDESLSVEQLSRGTREQVFLALRLALAASYGRRGTKLPIILDDVLVNFDVARAQAAAEMLKQFAERGNQVLLFTCHEHIRDIFRDLEVPTRTLPHASDVAAKVPQEIRDIGKAKRRRRRDETVVDGTRSGSSDGWDWDLFDDVGRSSSVPSANNRHGHDRDVDVQETSDDREAELDASSFWDRIDAA